MRHITQEQKEWEERQGYSKKILLSEEDIGVGGARFQLVRIKPGETAKSHHHKEQTEIFHFLNDNGHFIVNEEKLLVKKGDALVIRPGDRHEVINDTKEDFLYSAYKIGYREGDLYWD